ncbi:hypothetical protein [Bradyrhizobium sp. DOA1]|uniref:hypothetical protein n=1 Tax=Bradyrhizobium sp. DOA1 TaxID=1126616 RepID=UPI0012E7E20E|nr:hypothetical protein [Bradyrhizobium sp. DOA1]
MDASFFCAKENPPAGVAAYELVRHAISERFSRTSPNARDFLLVCNPGESFFGFFTQFLDAPPPGFDPNHTPFLLVQSDTAASSAKIAVENMADPGLPPYHLQGGYYCGRRLN